jgi:rhodanese-related sulfurtransferase
MRPALLLIFAAVFSFTCAAFAQTPTQAPVLPEVKLPPQARAASVEDVEKFINARKDTGILDLRMVEELATQGRIPGAKHLDFFHEQFSTEVLKIGLDPTKPCVIYCALGGRAKRAAGVMAQAGFKEIVVLTDGFNAWKKAGKAVEGGR